MIKNKHYFLKIAIIKTMIAGCFYLIMPIIAKVYNSYTGGAYIGYTIFGAGIMILGNIILLAKSWALALDADARRAYLKPE